MAWRETERQSEAVVAAVEGGRRGGVTLGVRRAWRGHAVGEDRESRWGEGREGREGGREGGKGSRCAQDVFFLLFFPPLSFLPPSLRAASGGGGAEPVSPLARLTSD